MCQERFVPMRSPCRFSKLWYPSNWIEGLSNDLTCGIRGIRGIEVMIRAIPPPDVEVMLECIKARKENKQIWRANDFKKKMTEIESERILRRNPFDHGPWFHVHEFLHKIKIILTWWCLWICNEKPGGGARYHSITSRDAAFGVGDLQPALLRGPCWAGHTTSVFFARLVRSKINETPA